MYVVGIEEGYTMSIPLQVLATMGADFDGDVLNARLIINNDFLEYANRVFNPRNVLLISRNDGMFNNEANHSKDVIVNLNTMVSLGRGCYDNEMIAKLQSLKLV